MGWTRCRFLRVYPSEALLDVQKGAAVPQIGRRIQRALSPGLEKHRSVSCDMHGNLLDENRLYLDGRQN